MISSDASDWKKQLYDEHIHSARWRHLKNRVLAYNLHLCQDCLDQGRSAIAEHVHHIQPAEWAPDPTEFVKRFYDVHNLRPLCEACHIKAHDKLGRKGKKRSVAMAKEQLADNNRFWFGDNDENDEN